MKKNLHLRILVFVCTAFVCTFYACKPDYASKEYLAQVTEKLSTINSVSYYRIHEAWVPGDTTARFINQNKIEEYNNLEDTIIGTKFIVFDGNDTTMAEFCYDGKMRASFYPEHKGIIIDSFKVRKSPYRPIVPPFFNYAKSILDYVLTTKDSILLNIKDLDDSIYLKLTINEPNRVEFIGKAIHMPLSPYSIDNTSKFEMWINKNDNLPYKIRREISDEITVFICKKYTLNKLDINDFFASTYFPKDYEIRPYALGITKTEDHPLLHKKAPDWTLTSTANKTVSLKEYKNKITLLDFTSVCCGPCRASVPFLENLKKEYNNKDLEIVCIECTCKTIDPLKNYMKRTGLDCTFLLSDKDIRKKYSIESFPVFFLLDKNSQVVKVWNGYGKGSTDKEIHEEIKKELGN